MTPCWCRRWRGSFTSGATSAARSVATPARLAGKRILVVTGTDDLDHPVEVDGAIVTWLKEAGAAAEFIALGEHGIAGNGHMLMLEDNSDEIADLIIAWIDRALTAAG